MSKIILIIIAIIFVNEINAQIIEGSYSLVRIEHLENDSSQNLIRSPGIIIDGDNESEVQSGFWMLNLYYYAELNVYKEDSIYLKTCSWYDTGNTFFSQSGDYDIKLNSVEDNVYRSKNDLIDLTLTLKQNNDIEILINTRIIYI